MYTRLHLLKNKMIVSMEEIRFSNIKASLKSKFGSKILHETERGAKNIRVYKILYRSGWHNVLGFIVEPKRVNSKIPCIIWNRGGSRDFGSIKIGSLFRGIGEFARRGYIVIATNYSGAPGSEGEDEWGGSDLADVLNLHKILKSHPRADISRIGMYGWSRGGFMTYKSLAKVKWIRAAVIGGAPTDEVSAPKFRKGWREHQISMYGKNRSEQIKRSAIYWADKFSKKTPVLIMHGTADWRVDPLDSIKLAEKLHKYKVPFRLVMYEGADHGIQEFREEVKDATFYWFEKYLKRREKWPSLMPHGA